MSTTLVLFTDLVDFSNLYTDPDSGSLTTFALKEYNIMLTLYLVLRKSVPKDYFSAANFVISKGLHIYWTEAI